MSDHDHFDALTDEIATTHPDERPDLTRGLARTILAGLTAGVGSRAPSASSADKPDGASPLLRVSSGVRAPLLEDGTAGPGSPAIP